MAYVGQVSGRHYNSYEEMVAGERIAAARRDASIIAEDDAAIAAVPLETLRKIAERAAIADDTALGGSRSRADVATWLALRPEYKDGSETNTRLMNHELARQGVRINPTVAELETAYNSLTASNLLDLNQKVLREQETQRTKERASGIKTAGGPLAPKHSEQELYDMPLEDLRRLSNRMVNEDQPWQTEKQNQNGR